MEFLGAAQSVAQTLFESVQNHALQEMCSVWGYESELESLQGTVDTIKAVLLDAESKQDRGEVLTHQVKLWVEQLKAAIYDADDLLDKFVTLAEQKQLRDNDMEGLGRLFKKVCQFCSLDNPFLVALKMSREVREVRNKLDSIAQNHNRFEFKFDSQPIRRRREETCSYVYAQDIIGREADVEKIVARLLDLDVQQDVSCLAIVGIGGLGKTTLAQLVYNDDRVKENFPLRLWVCVGDLDKTNLDVKDTLCKILHSATSKNHQNLSVDHLQSKLREQLEGRRYLIVLDDMWNEVRNQWLDLEKFLMSGLKGSWILVTTRSEKTAMAIGNEHPYKLKGLSQQDSWSLFMMAAFGQRVTEANVNLLKIGRKIVERCANVPLAIRVVGSLLYGQGINKWLLLEEMGLGRIKQGDKGIEPILKLSYDNLESPIKTCFGYCALFPKDYEIEKQMLVMLWIAQGFVIPLDEGQSIEDAGEEYFSILLKRCFFQDVVKNAKGEIVTCKIHDLMHDIAEEVAGNEIHKNEPISSTLINKARHLFFYHGWNMDVKSQLITSAKIRTCLRAGLYSEQVGSPLSFGAILANWKSLRVLDLRYSRMMGFPTQLSELLHLRYLDLSDNRQIVVLPNSIAELHNLEFLILEKCLMLRELPEDMSKLTKLKVLDAKGCGSLVHMPSGIGKLSCLWKLTYFVVGEGSSSSNEGGQLSHQVEGIKALQNLKGNFHIKVNIPNTNVQYTVGIGRKEGCLSPHLAEAVITFPQKEFDDVKKSIYEIEEELLEDLQPHPNLRGLSLEWYCGRRMPNWVTENNLQIFLPSLVSLFLVHCHKLQHMEVLRKLPKLKILALDCLNDLEYIENTSSGAEASESDQSFFPSLEKLELWSLPKLKGWWKDDSSNNQNGVEFLPSFPRLSYLQICDCANLEKMPLCPNLEDLMLSDCNVNLRIMGSIKSGNSKLRSVMTDSVVHLKLALPVEAFWCLKSMVIHWGGGRDVETLSGLDKVFLSCSASLQKLQIKLCPKLKSLSGVLEHLTALEKLVLDLLPNLILSKEGEGDGNIDDDGMPWRSLMHSLRSLELNYLTKLVKLPNGMRYLTALKSLRIKGCEGLKSMPEWMPELTSLTLLHIGGNYTLKRRCCKLTGEDGSKIQHIPNVMLS